MRLSSFFGFLALILVAIPLAAQTGTIIIAKETFPAGATGFGFTESINPGVFSLNDGQSMTFSNVSTGTYVIGENDPSPGGYTLADVSCDDIDSSGDVASRTATVQLGAGETVTCRFRNLRTAPTDQLFIFHLTGDQEVPPVTAPARGGCMGRFDAGASQLSMVCTHNVADGIASHIHRGAPGVNGPILFDLGDPSSPIVRTWSGMVPADVADLLAGNLYVNIHTPGNPGGFIRGQILPLTVGPAAFVLDGSQVVPPSTTPATGNCVADIDTTPLQLAIGCTHNVPSPTAAHVHQAPFGANGPVIHTFASPASPIAEDVPLTPRLVADFAAALLYLDVHGTVAGEEIRGQMPTAVPPSTDLSIVKTVSGSPFYPGSLATFTMVVTNAGPGTAFATTVTDALPSGTTFVSAGASQGTCSGTSTVTCALGSLGAGASATVTIQVTLPAQGGPFSNTASVVSSSGDVNPADNASTAAFAFVMDAPTLSPLALAVLALALAAVALWRQA